MLIVAAGEPSTWEDPRTSFHRLRRDDDQFFYEAIVVGSFEDALLAAMFNYGLQIRGHRGLLVFSAISDGTQS